MLWNNICNCYLLVWSWSAFALQVMQFTLASLLHGFDFATPSNEPVDMGEGLGLTMEKSTLLEVLVVPRLSASLYG